MQPHRVVPTFDEAEAGALGLDLGREPASLQQFAFELARFPAPFSGVLPDLFVAGDDTARNPFACTRCGNQRRSIWTRTTCPIGVAGSRFLRHRYGGSSPTMAALMETRPRPREGAR